MADPDAPLLKIVVSTLAATALVEGVQTYLVAPLDDIPAIAQALATLPFKNRVLLRAPTAVPGLAQECACLQPGMPRSTSVNLDGCRKDKPEDLFLLQRAFSDCSEVRFSRLDGGRSADVFQAFARLRDSRAGPYPLPFFVKLDRYTKISRELDNYRDCTTLFIPFFARPNLDFARCIRGAERGLIVGNFVEHS
ncbi:hypothetical protein [Bradyrhizobium sp. BR 1432]|uniref:hypothetical protein n=1 Tax=Bradyrhizobium sp. BR 1432 TaxID=3447966 RepID=UPI003EE7B152